MKFINNVCLFLIANVQISYAQANFNAFFVMKTEPTKRTTVTTNEVGITFKSESLKNKMIENTLIYRKMKINQESNSYSFYNDTDYYSIQNQFEYTNVVNQKIQFRLKAITALNYQTNISWNNLLLLGGVIFDYKVNQSNSLSGGLLRSTALGSSKFLPYFKYNLTINENLKTEIGFPNTRFLYTNNSRNLFYLDHSYEGNEYCVNQYKKNNTVTYESKFSFSQINTTLNYERSVDEKWKASFRCGYSYQKKYKTTNIEQNDSQNTIPIKNGLLSSISLQYNF